MRYFQRTQKRNYADVFLGLMLVGIALMVLGLALASS
jgi:hypothetical protein